MLFACSYSHDNKKLCCGLPVMFDMYFCRFHQVKYLKDPEAMKRAFPKIEVIEKKELKDDDKKEVVKKNESIEKKEVVEKKDVKNEETKEVTENKEVKNEEQKEIKEKEVKSKEDTSEKEQSLFDYLKSEYNNIPENLKLEQQKIFDDLKQKAEPTKTSDDDSEDETGTKDVTKITESQHPQSYYYKYEGKNTLPALTPVKLIEIKEVKYPIERLNKLITTYNNKSMIYSKKSWLLVIVKHLYTKRIVFHKHGILNEMKEQLKFINNEYINISLTCRDYYDDIVNYANSTSEQNDKKFATEVKKSKSKLYSHGVLTKVNPTENSDILLFKPLTAITITSKEPNKEIDNAVISLNKDIAIYNFHVKTLSKVSRLKGIMISLNCRRDLFHKYGYLKTMLDQLTFFDSIKHLVTSNTIIKYEQLKSYVSSHGTFS
jgi:hypothetical protein